MTANSALPNITTDQAADMIIDTACRELRLPTIRTQAGPLADQSSRANITHRAYLAELLNTELDERQNRRYRRRIKEAHLPRLKYLDDFNYKNTPINPTTIATLTQHSWIKKSEPLILIGNSGTGKTHILIGLAITACQQGYRVRYTTTQNLANELAEAAETHTLTKTVRRYTNVDLLCLDELGYVHLDPTSAELLFQIITEREERAPIAVATNLPFSEWGQIFANERLAAAVVDRLTYNATIIQTGTDSYRLKTTKKGAAQPNQQTN